MWPASDSAQGLRSLHHERTYDTSRPLRCWRLRLSRQGLISTVTSMTPSGASTTAFTTVAAVAAPYRGSPALVTPAVVALAATSDGRGYYVLRSNGEVDAFGVPRYGSVPAGDLTAGVTATGIAYDAATGGYWVVSSDGRVRGFHAPSLGGPRIHRGVRPYASAVARVDADGRATTYLRANGGVEGFGVPWHGSLAGKAHLRRDCSSRRRWYRHRRRDWRLLGTHVQWSGHWI